MWVFLFLFRAGSVMILGMDGVQGVGRAGLEVRDGVFGR